MRYLGFRSENVSNYCSNRYLHLWSRFLFENIWNKKILQDLDNNCIYQGDVELESPLHYSSDTETTCPGVSSKKYMVGNEVYPKYTQEIISRDLKYNNVIMHSLLEVHKSEDGKIFINPINFCPVL